MVGKERKGRVDAEPHVRLLTISDVELPHRSYSQLFILVLLEGRKIGRNIVKADHRGLIPLHAAWKCTPGSLHCHACSHEPSGSCPLPKVRACLANCCIRETTAENWSRHACSKLAVAGLQVCRHWLGGCEYPTGGVQAPPQPAAVQPHEPRRLSDVCIAEGWWLLRDQAREASCPCRSPLGFYHRHQDSTRGQG